MPNKPWYKYTYRWCQTNLTEIDAKVCDVQWWREYWKKNRIQGIIVNAGGIVAYYPSDNPLQYRSRFLNGRDLLGEFEMAAREDGITVLARMDINRASEDFYRSHPNWFAVDKEGKPYKAGDLYLSCINSDYYKKYIPEVLAEIIEKYHPDGFTDNSWQGVSAEQICYCINCRRKFKEGYNLDLPTAVDWNDRVYKTWIKWSFKCRIENWDLFNKVTKEYGGEDCLWLGMVNANPMSSHCALYDLKEVGERSVIMMCDHQSRDEINGLEQNSLNGWLLHGVSSWDAIIPESMANYIRGVYTFRRGSNPPKETRYWMNEGIAGGLSPWAHYVGSVQEDRRQYRNCEPVMIWHEKNEQYLYNREPVANIGLVWSQLNINFYGKGNNKDYCAYPWRGFTRALTRSRIPFLPVHSDHIRRDSCKLSLLIMPDIAVFTDEQLKYIEDFVKGGGSIIYTGSTGMLDEWGDVRSEFLLDNLFGIIRNDREIFKIKKFVDWENYQLHNYIRLPKNRHEILNGFEDTAILPFGGQYYHVTPPENMEVVCTYVPSFPIYPPEFSYMNENETSTDIPIIIAGETQYGGRVVYFAGDIDRRYGQGNLGDHGKLLENAINWAVKGKHPIRVEGPGYLDCKLYRKDDKFILHIINLSGLNQNPGFVEECYPVGPIKIAVDVGNKKVKTAALKVSEKEIPVEVENGWAQMTVERIQEHELLVF